MATTEMPTVADSADVHEQLRAATDLLERIAADWRLLDRLTAEDRRRLHQAIAGLSVRIHGRNGNGIRPRKRRASGGKKRCSTETGIRTLRRRPIVTTPNVFPPKRLEAHDDDHEAPAPNDDPRTANDERRTSARVCYVCKQPTRASTTSTISSAPPAPMSISPRARSSRTCAAVSRC